jgi:hypothetical protein
LGKGEEKDSIVSCDLWHMTIFVPDSAFFVGLAWISKPVPLAKVACLVMLYPPCLCFGLSMTNEFMATRRICSMFP